MIKTRYQATRHISILSAAKNSLLSILKIVIGYVGHSHALIADGIHSLSDLITDGLTLIAAKAGGQLPDEEHPYGHQRIETIAAIIIAFILIFVAISLSYDAIYHLLHKKTISIPEISVVVVAIFSLGINEALYQYTYKIGNKFNSNLLISSAWHNRSDALVSIVVLVGVIGTWIGLVYLDLLCTLLIALLIFKIAGQMIWSGVSELIDTGVDTHTLNDIISCIQKVSGVLSIHQLRTRLHGGNIYIDVHILVEPFISVSEGHYISDHVYLSLLKKFKNILDVTVHIDSEDDEKAKPSLHLPNRAQLTKRLNKVWCDLPGFTDIQKILLHYINGEIWVEVYLPCSLHKNNNDKTLTQSYRQAATSIKGVKKVNLCFVGELED